MRQSYLDMKENIDINIQLVSPKHNLNQKASKAKSVLLRLSQQDSSDQEHEGLYPINNEWNSMQKQKPIIVQKRQSLSNAICIQHDIYIGYRFCLQCYCYNICQKCLSTYHKGHMILTFENEDQTKELTKQFLIQKIEQTLVKMKSRQNQVKNHTAQIELIKNKIKSFQEEIIASVRKTFDEIQSSIATFYYAEEKKYFQSVDKFYEQYNYINDQLRETLLQIVDSQINLSTFKNQQIMKQPPNLPIFDKFKMTLEKAKKYYRGIIQQLKQLQSGILSNNKKKNMKNKENSTLKKYDKFLSKLTMNQATQGKSSLLKTLNIIQNIN